MIRNWRVTHSPHIGPLEPYLSVLHGRNLSKKRKSAANDFNMLFKPQCHKETIGPVKSQPHCKLIITSSGALRSPGAIATARSRSRAAGTRRDGLVMMISYFLEVRMT